MNETLVEAIVTLKTEFMKRNEGGSHIQEIMPTLPESLSIDEHELEMLHKFAESNSIYSDSYEMNVLDTVCKVYQGDVNNYWLDSIKHDTSYAPFYPIWILSAYALVLESKNLGVKQIIDIGSGDGRIAYCAKVAGLESYGIEIDENGSWKPLDLNKTYGMVSNNFIRGGGDGYKVFRSASEIYDFGPDLADVVANYIKANPGYSGYTDNRITQE